MISPTVITKFPFPGLEAGSFSLFGTLSQPLFTTTILSLRDLIIFSALRLNTPHDLHASIVTSGEEDFAFLGLFALEAVAVDFLFPGMFIPCYEHSEELISPKFLIP